MNPKIVKLKEASIVIGLEWELLDYGVAERKAIRDILKKNSGVKSGVLVRAADVATLGMMGPGQKKPNVPSGAALLALANQDAQARVTGQSSSIEDNQWIVVERLGEDEYWVVDIKDGVPLPGTDFVASYEKVRLYLSEMIEGTGFKVFTTDSDIQAAVSHQAMTIPKGAADLIEELEKPSRGNLKTLSGIDPAMVGVIVVFAVLVGGFFAWDYWNEFSQRQAQQRAASERASAEAQRLAAEKQEYVQAIEKAVHEALDQGVESVNSALRIASPRDVIRAWTDIVGQTPLNHSGWSTESLECLMETATQPVCIVNLRRTDMGINRILLTDYPQAEINGDDASYVIRGPELAVREPMWSEVDSAQAFMMGLMSDFQFVRKTGLNYTQGESKDVVQSIAMPTPPASVFNPADTGQATPVPPINTGMAQGTIGLGGEDLWLLQGISQLIDRSAISLTSMSVDVSGYSKQPWTAQGTFFIRTLPAPVIPVVPGPDGPITISLPAKYESLVSDIPTQGGVAATTAMPLAPEQDAGEQQEPDPRDEGPISLGLPSTDPSP